MFVHDYLPFSLANSGTFRKTVTDLDPKIKVKQGRTYSKYVRNDEQKVKKSIKSLLRKNVKGVLGLTADMWDDRKQNSLSQPNSTSTQVGIDKVISWTTTTI